MHVDLIQIVIIVVTYLQYPPILERKMKSPTEYFVELACFTSTICFLLPISYNIGILLICWLVYNIYFIVDSVAIIFYGRQFKIYILQQIVKYLHIIQFALLYNIIAGVQLIQIRKYQLVVLLKKWMNHSTRYTTNVYIYICSKQCQLPCNCIF